VAKFDGYDAAANPDTLRMMAEGYFQGHEPKDPLVSPAFADLDGMPPIYITASQDEVLYSDSLRIVENAKRAGVKVTERWVDDSVHIYPVFPFLPETEVFLNDIAAWSEKL
jgi:salicylate hydroxylase